MRIVIESLPHNQHRYPTVGDYWRDSNGDLQIRVSEMPDHRHMVLVALHELIEVSLCEDRGIPEPEIKAFDEAHLNADEPGALPDAPYHSEHVFADCIERFVARELRVNQQQYDAAVRGLDE